jgi:DNA invertase Pin-like site-specific DNA recombinase
MKTGYTRVSKAGGSQILDLQIDVLFQAGIHKEDLYQDQVSGSKEDPPVLGACLKALCPDDQLIVCKLE